MPVVRASIERVEVSVTRREYKQKRMSRRTLVGKKGVRRQKGGPSDWRPVVGLREEPDREGEAQEPKSAGTPRTTADETEGKTRGGGRQTDEQASAQAGTKKTERQGRGTSRRTGRQAGRQASKQAGRQPGRQAGGQAGRQAHRHPGHPPIDNQTIPVRVLSSQCGEQAHPHPGVSRTENCGNDKQAGRHKRTRASTQSRTSR